MNTDTPETDSAYIQRPNEGAWDFRVRQEKTMEKLERERDEARECLERCSRAHCKLGSRLRSRIVYFENQRDKWEETARLYCQNSDYHQEMREKAERERDEAREKIKLSREWSAAIADIADYLQSELAAVTEQRDRLAEALQALIDCIQETRGKDAHDAITNAHEILQSLNIKP